MKKKSIQQLITERDQFLEKHPQLKAYQELIDKGLKNIGDHPEARLLYLSKLLMGKLVNELVPNLEKLNMMYYTLYTREKRNHYISQIAEKYLQ